DMKPDAPADFRGQYKPIQTKVPGFDICELMPLQATIADKMSVIRNMCFLEYTAGHNPPLVYTGYPTATSAAVAAGAAPSRRPTFGSVVSRLRGDAVPDMPPYVAFDHPDHNPVRGADYLGIGYRPFVPVDGKVDALGPTGGVSLEQMASRKELLRTFDTLRRDVDATGSVAGIDAFQARALDIITTPKARNAFDISQESEKIRAKYGKGGTQFLQARRLVEAGVQVVTLTSHSETKVWDVMGTWDHHGNIFPG